MRDEGIWRTIPKTIHRPSIVWYRIVVLQHHGCHPTLVRFENRTHFFFENLDLPSTSILLVLPAHQPLAPFYALCTLVLPQICPRDLTATLRRLLHHLICVSEAVFGRSIPHRAAESREWCSTLLLSSPFHCLCRRSLVFTRRTCPSSLAGISTAESVCR